MDMVKKSKHRGACFSFSRICTNKQTWIIYLITCEVTRSHLQFVIYSILWCLNCKLPSEISGCQQSIHTFNGWQPELICSASGHVCNVALFMFVYKRKSCHHQLHFVPQYHHAPVSSDFRN